jgi:carbonic anhydrase
MKENNLLQKKTKVHQEVLDANENYAANFEKDLGLPCKKICNFTCMDARLDPAKYAGLSEGDAHVIRNAGGRASDDAISVICTNF